MTRTTTRGRRDVGTSPRRRFARGSTEQSRPPRRFGRAGGRTQPKQSGVQKVMQRVRGVLPGGSSAKRGKPSGSSIPVVGGLVSSLGKKRGRGAGRGRKPAMFGLLGAGAAGAAGAAAVARRRQSSDASTRAAGGGPAPTAVPGGVSESTGTAGSAVPVDQPDTAAPGGPVPSDDTAAEDEAARRPDTPAEGDQPG